MFISAHLKDETDFLEYPFIPSVESDAISDPFLPAHPEVLKKSATPVPIITGLTDLEGFIGLNSELFLLYLPNKVPTFLMNQNFIKILVMILVIMLHRKIIKLKIFTN